jgi:MerR family transcriptional regulator, copper efflux regulator
MKTNRNPISDPKNMTVGELAKKAGVTPRTIRYYEEVGLLPQLERTSNGYRTYTEKHLFGVRQIRRAKRLGFSLNEIKELSGIRLQNPENEAEMVLRAIEIVKAHLNSTHKKMKDMKDHISLLENEVKRLEDILKNVSA